MALREILSKFGFEFVDADKVAETDKKSEGLISTLKQLGTLLIGGAVVSGFKSLVVDIQEAGDAISDTSAQLGVATDELQKWHFVAQMSGSSAESLNTALVVLQKNISAAAEGGKEAAAMFAELKVPVRDSTGELKASTEILEEVGIKLANIEDPSQRTTAALKLLGKQGASLVPIFAQGEDGLKGLLGEFEALGGGFSEEALEGAGAVGDALDKMRFASVALKGQLSATLFPTLAELIGLATKIAVGFGKLTDGTHILKSAIGVLGTIAVAMLTKTYWATLKTYAGFLPWILLIGLLILLVDDLWTLFDGGDSVIGRVLDSLFGIGTAKKVVQGLKDAWNGLFGDLEKFPGFWEKVKEVFSRIGKYLGQFFTWLWEKIKEWGPQLADFFKDLGKKLIDGLIGGLKKGWDALKEAFTNIGIDLIDAFKKLFKINSPSRVMYDLTMSLPEGSVKALADGAPQIAKQADKTFSAAKPAIDVFALPATSPFAFPAVLPSTSVSSATPTVIHYGVEQTNHNMFQLSGGSGTGVADAAREGVSSALRDDRAAALAALETLAEDES